ncbi:hypothetical protein GGS20DRAFT_560070 [Poronia punctata]|nr:hypothetical protein GGS20DRAFT_560070 [Poronia punctata]
MSHEVQDTRILAVATYLLILPPQLLSRLSTSSYLYTTIKGRQVCQTNALSGSAPQLLYAMKQSGAKIQASCQ